MTRARGPLLDYKPQQATRELLDRVAGVLTEYAEHLPLTLRQPYEFPGPAGFWATAASSPCSTSTASTSCS